MTPKPMRVYELLAASAPEPLHRCDLMRRLSLNRGTVNSAIEWLEKAKAIRRVWPMLPCHGYAYTINAEVVRPAGSERTQS